MMEMTIDMETVINAMFCVMLLIIILMYSDLIMSLQKENKLFKRGADELAGWKQKYGEAQNQVQKLAQDNRQLEQSVDYLTGEASRLHIAEKAELQAQQLISKIIKLDENLAKIQQQHESLLSAQQELHRNLLREHDLLNQYFQNYS